MNAALAEKQKCQDEADATAATIDLANRLVNGLASEKIRWTEEVKMLVFIISYFVSSNSIIEICLINAKLITLKINDTIVIYLDHYSVISLLV